MITQLFLLFSFAPAFPGCRRLGSNDVMRVKMFDVRIRNWILLPRKQSSSTSVNSALFCVRGNFATKSCSVLSQLVTSNCRKLRHQHLRRRNSVVEWSYRELIVLFLGLRLSCTEQVVVVTWWRGDSISIESFSIPERKGGKEKKSKFRFRRQKKMFTTSPPIKSEPMRAEFPQIKSLWRFVSEK